MAKIILLEDTWNEDNEADDIIEYADKNKYDISILSVDDLYKLDSMYFLSTIYFCDTKIVQYHLQKANIINIVPNTYDEKYNKYYNRSIEQIHFTEFIKKYDGIKRFIKPVSNDKDFSGRVIETFNDFENYGVEIPNTNQMVYSCEPVEFISEIRLLIGNNKLYGHGYMSGKHTKSYLKCSTMLDDLITITNNDYCCIDIGLMVHNSDLQWSIIEINPPFSIDDHEILFDDYISFCIDACRYIYTKL